MDSPNVPATHQQLSTNLLCDVCQFEFQSQERLNFHYGEMTHTVKCRDLAKCVFGYMPEKRITCLDDIFNNPKRQGAFIGLHYLKDTSSYKKNPCFSCLLCGGVACQTMFQHVLSMKHKKKYIQKEFSFLFENVERFPLDVIEKIAVLIEDAEGIQKFKLAIKNPIEKSESLKYLDKIVEQLRKHRIVFKNPYQGHTVPCLGPGLHSLGIKEKKIITNPNVPSEASENSSRQKVNDKIEKLQIHGIDYKNRNRKEGTVPFLATGSHSSGTNEKKAIINPSVPSKLSAASENSSRQVNDKIIEKPRIHAIGVKDTYQKVNTVSCFETGSHASGINDRNGKRPSQFTPLTAFKRCKSELPRQYAEKPIVSLSRPVPVPSLFSHTSVGVKMNNDIAPKPIPSLCRSNQITWPSVEKRIPSRQNSDKMHENNYFPASKFPTTSSIPTVNIGLPPKPIPSLCRLNQNTWPSVEKHIPFRQNGDKMHENNSLPASKFPTTSSIPTVNNGMPPKPIPSLCRSYQITWPSVEKHIPSRQPAQSCYQNAEYRYGYYSDQNRYEFANKSAYGQANPLFDVGHAYAVQSQTCGQETGHPGAKQLHTLETTGVSVSSPKRPSGQCSTEVSLKQDTLSSYGYNSVDSKELSSKSYLPSRILSVLKKEPSSPMSHGNTHHSEGSPPTTSTSSCAQTSQSTNSSMPAKTVNILSPDTLKILQGRDPTSVKSILKRLAEYCPELQQVNISLLVDVMFETGVLR